VIAMIDTVESTVRALGAIAGLTVLAFVVAAMLRAVRRPAARQEAGALRLLRPAYLLVATALFVGVGVLLWRPLPLVLSKTVRIWLLIGGSLLYFGGLVLYVAGMRFLGGMFAPSTGFGVRVQAPRHLVTSGPYARMRHPMYVGVIALAVGSCLLYRTWASLLFAVSMFGLVVRGRREDTVLASEFGDEWSAYAACVRAWMPRLHHPTRRT
jgi:protein-S-isoprenylcysteine O-methyltransferase Ste14